MLTVPEAARRVGRDPETIRRWIRSGRLRSHKVGTQHVIEEADLDQVIEERALPFQVGEEVLVRIDEPHMYNADDAVARVDSYIVSVTDGGRFVGDRRLVRIESVGRSAATASLVGDSAADPATDRTTPAGEAGDAGGGDSGQVRSPSSRRRRGRRGGRRRSGARAANGSKSNGDVSGTTS